MTEARNDKLMLMLAIGQRTKAKDGEQRAKGREGKSKEQGARSKVQGGQKAEVRDQGPESETRQQDH